MRLERETSMTACCVSLADKRSARQPTHLRQVKTKQLHNMPANIFCVFAHYQ